MSQRLREGKVRAGRNAAGRGVQGAGESYQERPLALDDAGCAARPGKVDQATLGYIVSMTREMKRMAQKAGLVRVALILEMAELEAVDQSGGKRF